jgi:hypothetical protein
MHVHNLRDGELKLGVAADMVSFLGLFCRVLFYSFGLFTGFQGELNDTFEHARKYNMTKIYDSLDFNADEAFAFLGMLLLFIVGFLPLVLNL